MLTSIQIQNFKGFKDTKIDTLKRVNLVVGGQNVGKTSLLEAVWLDTSDAPAITDLPYIFRINKSAEHASEDKRFWLSMFPDGQQTHRVELRDSSSTTETAIKRPFDWDNFLADKAPQNFMPLIERTRRSNNETELLNADQRGRDVKPQCISVHQSLQADQAELFAKVTIAEKDELITELLQKIEPRLTRLRTVSSDYELRLYVSLMNHTGMLPLTQLGHGFTRLLNLYSQLLIGKSKLALIDEIENGIHYSALPTVFEGIKDITQTHGVQSIITTHSKECIRAACDAFKDSPDDFQVIRLVRKDDNIEAQIIPYDYVEASLEMRGELR